MTCTVVHICTDIDLCTVVDICTVDICIAVDIRIAVGVCAIVDIFTSVDICTVVDMYLCDIVLILTVVLMLTFVLLLTCLLLILCTVIMKVGWSVVARHSCMLQEQLQIVLRLFQGFGRVMYISDNESTQIYTGNAWINGRFDVFRAIKFLHVSIFPPSCFVHVS